MLVYGGLEEESKHATELISTKKKEKKERKEEKKKGGGGGRTSFNFSLCLSFCLSKKAKKKSV